MAVVSLAPEIQLIRVRHKVALKERPAITKGPVKNSRVDPIRAHNRRLDRYTVQLVFTSAGQARGAAAAQIRC